MKLNLFLLAILTVFAGSSPAHAAEFTFPGQTLSVPDGFTVELIAGPPWVNRPISIAFDEQGRLYATDSAGMSDKAEKQLETKPHRVVRLADTNGDGKFDQGAVYAEHMMFPEGAMFYEGSLYVAAPPEIWKLTDADGDGVAEKREVWHDGKTLGGCGNDLHGPYLGRDGWIYWCKGAWAEQHYSLPNGKPAVTRSSQIFRRRPGQPGQEPVLTGGMDNPVGVAFTSTGERFLSCTFFQNPAGGKRDGLIHAIYGGVYGKTHESLNDQKQTGGLMPVLVHMGAAAPCGLTSPSGNLFGGGFGDTLFACYFNLHKIVRHELLPDGATFKTKDTDFVTSDSQDFHPTDVLEDADGSLLIVDTGGWYKICCPTSQLAKPDVLGGIYRIRRIGAPVREDPRGLKLAWGTLPPAVLAKLLADPRYYVQQRAIAELGKSGEAAVTALRQVLAGDDVGSFNPKSADKARKTEKKSGTPHVVPYPMDARQSAVWALARIEGDAAREAVRTALNDTDNSVVHPAIHVVSMWRDLRATERLQTFLQGNNAALARAAAEALGRIGDKRAVPELLAAAGKHGGRQRELMVKANGGAATVGDPARVLEHSLIYALIEIGDATGTAAGLNTTNAGQCRAALIALDQMEGRNLKSGMVTPLLASNNPLLREAAAWIVGHHAEWGDGVAGFFRERLANQSLNEGEQGGLLKQLSQLAKASAIQELLATTVSDASATKDSRLVALRAMASAGVKETPMHWFGKLVPLLAGDDAVLTRQAVATARTLPLPKQGHAEFSGALLNVGRNSAVPADVRLDALAAAGSLSAVEPALFDFLSAHLADTQPMRVRSASANVLAKARLASEQQFALADSMQRIGPLETPKLLPAFEKSPTEALGLKLVASLNQSVGLAGLRVDLLKPLFAKYPPSVQQQSEALLKRLNADAAKQTAHLEELFTTCKNGDIRRGQAVFNSAKAACAICHAMGYLGGRLGPDLTNIGEARNERDLLEAIVYPSASFVRSYEPFTVVTKGGEDYSGIVLKDASDEVVLATGPETEQRVARADIKELRPGAVSLMPAGMDAVLTQQELADLLTFLKATQ